MTDMLLRCCPGCQRLAAPDARVCRACYTVIPKENPRKNAEPFRTRVKLLAGLKYVGMLFAAAVVASFLSVDASLNDAPGAEDPSVMASMRANFNQAIAGAFGQASQPGYRVRVTHNGRRASHPAVSMNEQCRIRQGILNLGDKPISRVDLKVAMRDSSGRLVTQVSNVATAVDIPVAEARELELKLPCPSSVARVEVSLPDIEDQQAPSQTVALVEGTPASEVARPTTANTSQVAIQMPDPTLCPSRDACELRAILSTGGSATFVFHRDPAEPQMLLSDDSLLIGHLLDDGTAVLQVQKDERAEGIRLTRRELRAKAQPSAMARWFRDLF
jgi:hypothetical protein